MKYPNLKTLLLAVGGISSNTEYARYIKNGSIRVLVAGFFKGTFQGEYADDWICRDWVKITDHEYIPVITDVIKCGKHKMYRCEMEYDADDAPNILRKIEFLEEHEIPTKIPADFIAIVPLSL